MEEIKKGYKQTELGWIPEDWDVKSVSETFISFSNNTLSWDQLNYDEGKVYNVHYGDVLIKFSFLLMYRQPIFHILARISRRNIAQLI